MNIHTAVTLRASRRCVDTRLRSAERVLAEMQHFGQALTLTHTGAGPIWALSPSGRTVPKDIARVVCGSASVVPVGDCLFDGVASQTWRYWRAEP